MKHQKICKKVFSTKRTAFDSSLGRTQEMEAAKGEAGYLAELLAHADLLIAKARAEHRATAPPAMAVKPIKK